MSSANNRVKLSKSSDISLIKIKNSRGPNTDPCGTPAFIYDSDETDFFTKTRCRRLLR